MGEIGEIISGGTPSTSNDNYWNGNISWITPADLSNYKEKYISRGKRNISIEGLENSSAKIICKGSVLFSSRAPIGYVVISEKEVTTNQGFKSISPYIENSEHYIYYFLLAEKENISLKASGTTFKELSGTEFGKIFFPLPPLSEQRRIVEKIEELLALVDDLETNKTDLQSYIKQAKSKVLEMAVRGELVSQNPDDEPASVLLERIKKEQKSSKSKGKTTAHNTHYEEELPFDIPENWVWCRLGEITMINPKNNIEDNKEVSFIPMTLISDGFSNKHSYEVRLWGEVKKGFTHFQEGDIGIAKITPCFENRKSVIFSNLVNEVGAGTTELHILRPFAYSEIKKYIYWFINTESFIQRGISHFSGAVGQQRVGKDILENTLIPLPPLAEQIRIVEKIEEIFSELEFIEEALI